LQSQLQACTEQMATLHGQVQQAVRDRYALQLSLNLAKQATAMCFCSSCQ
jgi:chaperonin cofactor prefoldin